MASYLTATASPPVKYISAKDMKLMPISIGINDNNLFKIYLNNVSTKKR
ncbi:hypothetical protein HMPREF1140_0746 [Lachnoanaerobaculum sp. ICM7]|nr:hypothetical protein HMPREF1140_0746 [Lachnoanaerobaculum sp. ICM7]